MAGRQPSPYSVSSESLPTVKCSNCGLRVPISSLSEHVCPRLPMRTGQPLLRSRSKSSVHLSTKQTATSHVPFPSIAAPPSPRPPDFMPGGESGMAGVGRRAFQAAAHPAATGYNYAAQPPQGFGSVRRGIPPQYLDISATPRGTPPLSPNSTHSSSRSLSPMSPLSQSPQRHAPDVSARPWSPPTPARSPYPAAQRNNSISSTLNASTRLPSLRDRYKNTAGQAVPTYPTRPANGPGSHTTGPARPASPAGSEGSIGGLAYDAYEQDEEPATGMLSRLRLAEKERTSSSSKSTYSVVSKSRMTREDLGHPSPRRSHTTAGPRSGTGGQLSPLGPSSPPPVRSISDAAKKHRRDKSMDNDGTTRTRVCVRCNSTIKDGRWVPTETKKGVLCERCWKNMYLPRCRRCDKPIEKAAVFSSDGQLKGKYHRECFTCEVCRQPFPDKSFYVHDGRPLCAFHYHEANRSLCAARSCGEPVEGPCAVTESGDRFHPRCLRCEHPGCSERLEDYWEVGGLRLCERHAQREGGEEEEEGGDTVGDLRRMLSSRRPPKVGGPMARGQKRSTRLINLSSGVAF